MKQGKMTTRKIVFTALMAALVCVSSAIRIVIPVDIGGTTAFHLGNIFCALSGILLGPWLGGAAAGLGSLIYDVIFYPAYISECWITFLTKGAYGLVSGLVILAGDKEMNYIKSVLATLAGALTYAVLYVGKNFLEDTLFLRTELETALIDAGQKGVTSLVNAAIAVVLASVLWPMIRSAIRRTPMAEKLGLL